MNIFKILIPILVVIASTIIGRFLEPIGILITPIVLVTLSLLIVDITELKSIWKSILLTVLIVLNDIGIKLFAGGAHDLQGMGFTNLMFLIGLIPSFIIFVNQTFKVEGESLKEKRQSVAIFLILITLHLILFYDLGIGRIIK